MVIDVLRATTTVAFALEAGAREIIPCLEVDDARRIAAGLPARSFVLGGERGGKKIDGFDLGNSPSEYTPERVNDKTVVFTTTNGTRALLHCHRAAEVLLGSLVNAQSLVLQLAERSAINLLCAGTDGEITREDVLAAGAMVVLLTGIASDFTLNDEALIAGDAWQSLFATSALLPGTGHFENYLAKTLRECRGGRNLIELGMDDDLVVAADYCRLAVVPIFRDSRITRLDVAS